MELQDITDDEIEEARRVLEDHIVDPLTKEGALESLVWCISSQAQGWEAASRFVYNLRDMSHPGDPDARGKYASLMTLRDRDKVVEASRSAGLRFTKANRCGPALTYFSGINNWWDEIVESEVALRKEYVDRLQWVGNKTYSFWHICLGGTKLIALDVHVMRGLMELGVEMNEYYVVPRARITDTQLVRKTPNTKDYERIEREARNLFSGDERFLLDNGNVDMALVDGVLWWKGANRGNQRQGHLFGNAASWTMPYSGPIK